MLSYAATDSVPRTVKDAAAKSDDKPRVDPWLAGVGMTALSLAMLGGLVLGLWFRYTDPFGWAPPPAAAAAPAADPPKKTAEPPREPKGILGLQGSEEARTWCQAVDDRLRNDKYRGDQGAKMAIRDLQEMVEAIQCVP